MPEGGGLGVADFRGDSVERLIGGFEQLLGLLDAQGLVRLLRLRASRQQPA